MKFHPMPGLIFVRRDDIKTQTDSGIFIVANETLNKQQVGTVVYAADYRLDGKTGEKIPLNVAIGERVFFTGGSEIEILGEKLVRLSHADIIAKAIEG